MEERQAKGYPEPMRRSVRIVPSDEWASQMEAAERLGISVLRVGALVDAGTLEPVHDPAGQGGVSRQSLERESNARSGAGFLARLRYALLDAVRALARGI